MSSRQIAGLPCKHTSLARVFAKQLEINVGGLLVKDSFGWNPYRTLPNFTDGDEPELFGSALATYLGLDASGATLIAVEIREQLWRHFQVYSVLLLVHLDSQYRTSMIFSRDL